MALASLDLRGANEHLNIGCTYSKKNYVINLDVQYYFNDYLINALYV